MSECVYTLQVNAFTEVQSAARHDEFGSRVEMFSRVTLDIEKGTEQYISLTT